jgi:hypothetical protein
MIKFKVLAFCFINLCLNSSASVLIFTHSFNRPDFIEWQYKTFKKFLEDDFEYIVFNDAKSEPLNSQITLMCQRYKIKCIRIPQNIHSYDAPGARHQDSIHYSLTSLILKGNGLVLMIDSDMFLVQPFSIARFMRGYDLIAVPQTRPNDVLYLWPGLVFMDLRTLPNKEMMDWHGGSVNGSLVDTGGQMHHYLKNNPQLKIKFINSITLPIQQHLMCDECQKSMSIICSHHEDIVNKVGYDAKAMYKIDKKMMNFLEHSKERNMLWALFLDNCFLHYCAATWYFEGLDNKNELLRLYMNDLLEENYPA